MSSEILKFINSYRTIGIEDIDEKIQNLQDDIACLQQFRKLRIAAGRVVAALPEDILFIIFNFVYQFLKTEYCFIRDWTTLTHVCQRWRNVLISSSSLWTIIDPSLSMDLARLWIERSGDSLPLHLQQYGNAVWSSEQGRTASMVLRQQSHRLQTIELRSRDDFHYKDDLERIAEAPSLKSLSICIHHNSPFLSTKFPPPSIHFSPAAPPSSRLLVDYRDCLPPETFQLHHLLRNLAVMEQLEDLSLKNAINTSNESHEINDAHITLPRLKHLRLSHKQINGFDILLHLSCPSIESMDVQVNSNLPRDHVSVTRITTLFYSHLPPPILQYYTLLGYRIEDYCRIIGMVSIWQSGELGRPSFRLSVEDTLDGPASAVLGAIYPPKHSLSVTTIEFVHDRRADETFSDIIRSFSVTLSAHINTLIVYELDSILSILSLVPYRCRSYECRSFRIRPGPVDPSQYTSLLPKLRHIVLYTTWCHDDALLELQDLFQARKSAGMGLESVKVCTWDEDEDDIENMRIWEANVGRLEIIQRAPSVQFGSRKE
ncbi:hypothetical protein ONZ45_g19355 [Pleurotus djamor]|nr:hypothetical protein ONZ45_g19355 [Pleurotus djamor]